MCINLTMIFNNVLLHSAAAALTAMGTIAYVLWGTNALSTLNRAECDVAGVNVGAIREIVNIMLSVSVCMVVFSQTVRTDSNQHERIMLAIRTVGLFAIAVSVSLVYTALARGSCSFTLTDVANTDNSDLTTASALSGLLMFSFWVHEHRPFYHPGETAEDGAGYAPNTIAQYMILALKLAVLVMAGTLSNDINYTANHAMNTPGIISVTCLNNLASLDYGSMDYKVAQSISLVKINPYFGGLELSKSDFGPYLWSVLAMCTLEIVTKVAFHAYEFRTASLSRWGRRIYTLVSLYVAIGIALVATSYSLENSLYGCPMFDHTNPYVNGLGVSLALLFVFYTWCTVLYPANVIKSSPDGFKRVSGDMEF